MVIVQPQFFSVFIKLLNKTRVRYARECRYLHANTETRESFRINALAINGFERLSGSRFTKDHAGSMDSKGQPSPRTNFSGDSLHRRFVLRAVALKFFDKTNFARMEVTVDLDFAKLSCAEIHAKQIQSTLSSGENARTHQ